MQKHIKVSVHVMVAFLYTESIQLTAAHSGGGGSDLTQEEVQRL